MKRFSLCRVAKLGTFFRFKTLNELSLLFSLFFNQSLLTYASKLIWAVKICCFDTYIYVCLSLLYKTLPCYVI